MTRPDLARLRGLPTPTTMRLLLPFCLGAALMLLACAVPAQAQTSPLYDAAREAGVSAADASGLSEAMGASVSEDKLLAPDGRSFDDFGFSVSLDGDRALVGAPLYVDFDNPSSSGADAGAAYVFVRQGSGWVFEDKITAVTATGANDAFRGDKFGYSVSLSGDRALIGAPFDISPDFNGGSVFVYVRQGSDWVFEDKITSVEVGASVRGQDAEFGWSVSLDGDRAAVGVPYGNENEAFMFERSGSDWVVDGTVTTVDRGVFGFSVSLSGDRVLVGLYLSSGEEGAAYVFERRSSGWVFEDKLVAVTATGASDDAPYSRFGWSVSLSADRALVGAPGLDRDDHTSRNDTGWAYVFARQGSDWVFEDKLVAVTATGASDAAVGDEFGHSVSLSGDRALIGSRFDDDGGSNSGSAYVFVRQSSDWVFEDKLGASDAALGDFFGQSVSLDRDRALVGAFRDDIGSSEKGSAYVLGLPPLPGPGFTARGYPGLSDIGDFASPTTADLDGDGDLDIVSGRQTGTFVYYENTAGAGNAPTFANRGTALGLGDIGDYSAPAVGDLDGDGDLDILAGEEGGGFVYFENTAGVGRAPSFAAPQSDPFGLVNFSSFSTPSIADLDGDGDLDIVSGQFFGSFVYWENFGGAGNAPSFGSPRSNQFGLSSIGRYSTPSVADLDGDGDLDLISGNTSGEFDYFENTAGVGSTPAFIDRGDAFLLGDVGTQSKTALGDLDGDGDLDLVVGRSDGTFVSFENIGNARGNKTAAVTGSEGWRMLSAPSNLASFGDLLGFTHTQGFSGADAPNGTPNVYLYDEYVAGDLNQGYRTPDSVNESPGLGRGLFAYLFADDDMSTPGVQGGFPKTLAVTGVTPQINFGWGNAGPGFLDFTDTGAPADDGWNLLGNPFSSWLDWDAVELTNVDAPVYVYDDAVASYKTYSQGVGVGSLPGGVVGPFQGFWVKANASSSGISANQTAPSNGGPLYKTGEAPTVVGLRLRPADGSPLPAGIESQAFLAVGVAEAEAGRDRLDALALSPAASAFVSLATDADGAALAIDARPGITSETTIELSVSAVGADGSVPLVLDWPGLDLPSGWTVRLLDREAGTSTVLADGSSYAFSLGGVAARPAVEMPRLTPSAPEALTTGRFALVVTPGSVVAGDGAPEALSLSPVMPNPARGTARLVLSLPTAERVRAAVYDALAREVAVLADGEMSGTAELRLDTARLAAGVYVIRVEGESFAETRRLTVVR